MPGLELELELELELDRLMQILTFGRHSGIELNPEYNSMKLNFYEKVCSSILLR